MKHVAKLRYLVVRFCQIVSKDGDGIKLTLVPLVLRVITGVAVSSTRCTFGLAVAAAFLVGYRENYSITILRIVAF